MLQPVLDNAGRSGANAQASLRSAGALRRSLRFYRALLDAQERAFEAALADRPARDNIAAYAMERVLPSIIDTSVASGPPGMTDRC